MPEEVAVIGADNEVLACELAYPPLSSVIPDLPGSATRLRPYSTASCAARTARDCPTSPHWGLQPASRPT